MSLKINRNLVPFSEIEKNACFEFNGKIYQRVIDHEMYDNSLREIWDIEDARLCKARGVLGSHFPAMLVRPVRVELTVK